MKRVLLSVFSWLLPSFLTVRAADELVLFAGDVPPGPIVIYRDAPPRTLAAARMLAEYLERVSGQKPELVEGEPSPIPGRAIWVGVQPALKPLFPDTDFDFEHPEEILIAATSRHVVIAGRDRWDPERMEAVVGQEKVTGIQQEYGTLNAVFTFMQDHLGVRWFWPGELGEDVPRSESISLRLPLETRYHPQIRSRGGAFHFSRLGNKGYGKSHEWTLRQRIQLGSVEMEGGHGFGDWWDRYHKEYPEIFALQPDGTRSGFPNPHNAKLCASNPKVWELWLEDVAADLAKDPNRTVFNASPNDGWSSGHCVCANCTAWDHPDGEPRMFHWGSVNQLRPATSDRDVTFANKLGELLKQKYPGKDYRVLMLSYGHSRPAPIGVRPADNVIMSVVANFFGRTGLVDRGSTRGDTYRSQFESWAKIVPSMLWRPNTGSPAGWQQGFPDLSVQQTIRDIKDVAAANCEGIYIDSVWEHWATQGPQYYLMAQLVWNPAADAEAILADYYNRAFGPAAPAVREYFEVLETERMAFTGKNGEAGVFSLRGLYTPSLLADSQARLERAAAAVPADSVYRRRVDFVRAGLTYTTLHMDNVDLMTAYWEKADDAIAGKVKANWQVIEKLIADHPYAINWGPVRSNTPRMTGLHPGSTKPRTQAKRANDLDQN